MKHFNKQLIRDSFFIGLVAAAIGFGINLFHPRGFVLMSRADVDGRRIVAISTDEARIKFDSKAALFIDAREKPEYDASRIAGAVNFPAGDALTGKQGMDAAFFTRPAEIVVYCDGVSCGASAIVARKLLEKTPRHIYIIEKGFPDWEARGYPVQRGVQ